MVDLDSIETGFNERSAPSAGGSNSRHASASTGFNESIKGVDARACEIGGDCCSHGPVGGFPGIVTF